MKHAMKAEIIEVCVFIKMAVEKQQGRAGKMDGLYTLVTFASIISICSWILSYQSEFLRMYRYLNKPTTFFIFLHTIYSSPRLITLSNFFLSLRTISTFNLEFCAHGYLTKACYSSLNPTLLFPWPFTLHFQFIPVWFFTFLKGFNCIEGLKPSSYSEKMQTHLLDTTTEFQDAFLYKIFP